MNELRSARLVAIAEREGISRNAVKQVYHWFRRKWHEKEEVVEDEVDRQVQHFIVRKGVPKAIKELEGADGDGSRTLALIREIAGIAQLENTIAEIERDGEGSDGLRAGEEERIEEG